MGAEKKFESTVKKWLKSKEIYYFKYFGNAYSTAGITDLTLCVNGRYVGVELKSEHGQVSALQAWNIDEIRRCGGIALILKPSGFDDFKKLIEDLLDDKPV